MLRGIIFDKDGTLFSFADTWGAWCERLVVALAPDDKTLQRRLGDAVGFDMQTKAFVAGSAVVNASADETCSLLAELLPEFTVKQIEATGLDLLEGLPLSPVTDLPSLFVTLRNSGFKLGLATNDYEVVAHKHLKQLAVIDQFDFICGYDSGFGSKPGSGMIEAYCKATELDVSEVVMVGDSTHDLLAGRAAGVGLCVGVLTGPAEAEDLAAHADEILGDISGLPEVLSIK